MPIRLLPAALAAALACAPVLAQNCGGTSTGRTPLDDLGPGLYQGFPGGLYPGGSNARPPAHEAAGLAQAAGVVPRRADGAPDPAGRIVLLSIGMSNTTQEFSTFLPTSNADRFRNPAVAVVDGAQGGWDSSRITDPNATFWTTIEQRLANAGLTTQQVQVCWVKEAHAGPTGGFPSAAVVLQGELRTAAQILQTKYPNLRIAYLSSRIYAGYATNALNPEPYAYESGFSVKWLIEQQVNGDPALNWDPGRGPVVAPWLAWGPYLWADGLLPRSDGLTWACPEFQSDGVHPNVSARFKVADALDRFFRGDTTARPWYATATPHSVRAAVFQYGTGCPGTGGPPNFLAARAPVIGDPNFRVAVANALPGATGAFVLGLGWADVTVPDRCHLYVDPARIALVLGFAIGPTGQASIALPLPDEPALMGVSVYVQALVLDPGGQGAGGFSLTAGLRLIFGTA
jgi:hypothetical protein